MLSKEIIVVFFDIGGVLLSNGWAHESRQTAAKEFKYPYDEMENLHRIYFPLFEMGHISLEAYLNHVLFYQSRPFSKKQYQQFMFAQTKELPLLAWIKDWKKTTNIKTISLNNEGKELNDYRIAHFELHQCFDAFISSCNTGYRKPDPNIYDMALKIGHVKPEQCLYIDDRDYLINSAKQLGWNAYQHTDLEATKSILKQLIRR